MSNEDNVTPFRKPASPQQEAPRREPALKLPIGIKGLSLALILAFLLQKALDFLWGAETAFETVYRFAFVPARYTSATEMEMDLSGFLTPVTYMFLHGGWLHLFTNVTMIAAFGTGIEKALGTRKMLVLFFISGILAAFSQVPFSPQSTIPLVGASGGASGLFGAVMMMMYHKGYMGEGYQKLVPIVLIWALSASFFGFFGVPGAEGNIAWIPHIAGFIVGLLLFKPIMRLKIQP